MRRRVSVVCGILLLTALFATAPVGAATINAASATAKDIQAAISAAASGDVVAVPAGAVTWSTDVTIPNSKSITLRGAGATATVINGGEIHMGQSASRITGFGFVSEGSQIEVLSSVGFRIDHCSFTSTTSQDNIYIYGDLAHVHPVGVIDHNTFVDARVVTYGWATGLVESWNWMWAQDAGLGGSTYVFVEDNTFLADNNGIGDCVDSNQGGRYVFRYNTVTGFDICNHGVQGTNRASRATEVYNNTVSVDRFSVNVPIWLRAGAGVVFNNTMLETKGYIFSQHIVALDTPRANYQAGGGWPDGTNLSNLTFNAAAKSITRASGSWNDGTTRWGAGNVIQISGSASNNGNYTIASKSNTVITVNESLADEAAGATVRINQPWDSQSGNPPYACDQPGMGKNLSQNSYNGNLWAAANTYYPQGLDPVYEWNNTVNGSPIHFGLVNSSGPWILQGVHYINGTQKPGYVPYAYPHPLIALWNSKSGGTGGVPSAPTGLRIKN